LKATFFLQTVTQQLINFSDFIAVSPYILFNQLCITSAGNKINKYEDIGLIISTSYLILRFLDLAKIFYSVSFLNYKIIYDRIKIILALNIDIFINFQLLLMTNKWSLIELKVDVWNLMDNRSIKVINRKDFTKQLKKTSKIGHNKIINDSEDLYFAIVCYKFLEFQIFYNTKYFVNTKLLYAILIVRIFLIDQTWECHAVYLQKSKFMYSTSVSYFRMY